MVAMAAVFLLVRMGLAPLVDYWLCGADVRAAAARLNLPVSSNSPLARTGGWLRLPWSNVLSGTGMVPKILLDDSETPVNDRETLKMDEFRHYFIQFFTRDLVFWLWWLGPVLAVVMVRRCGGSWLDLPFALLAGSAAGVIGCASLACAFLMFESLPHFLWDLMLGGKGDSILLVVWVLLSLIMWTGMGAVVGLVCGLDSRLRQTFVVPAQNMLARVLPVSSRQ